MQIHLTYFIDLLAGLLRRKSNPVPEGQKVEYILIGSYAVGVYSEPRFTKDIDFLINPTEENAKAVLAALTEFGAPVDNLSVSDLAKPGLLYVFGISPLRVDILNRIEGVEAGHLIKNANTLNISGVKTCIVSLEDLIKIKELAGCPQDIADIEKLKKVEKDWAMSS